MRRRPLAVLVGFLAALLITLTGVGTAQAVRAPKPAPDPVAAAPAYPSSMSSLGDSITRGFNAAGWFSDWTARSWSTGSYSSVKSHYSRLVALNPAMSGHAYNDARTGAKMKELAGQATTATGRNVGYATVLMGANDACTSTEAGMTTVSAFGTQFTAAMEVLESDPTPPSVLVASIPDLYRLYSVGRSSSSARAAWGAYGICQSMLANPLSTTQADVDRRARVRQRVVDYNSTLAQVCAAYVFCTYDGGAVFGYPFTLSQLSTWDYFHPNTAGQAVLADVTYRAGFWPPTT